MTCHCAINQDRMNKMNRIMSRSPANPVNPVQMVFNTVGSHTPPPNGNAGHPMYVCLMDPPLRSRSSDLDLRAKWHEV